jgi:hypothetical protein
MKTAPYILEVDQHFRDAYCLHHQGNDGARTARLQAEI